jgi:hypothetical protein
MTFQKDVTREMTGPEADEKRQKIVELTLKADSLDNDVETLQGEVKSKKAEAVALRKSVSNMAADIQRHKTTDTFLCDRLVAYDDDGPYWAFVPENLPELAADEIPLHEIARSEMSEDDQEKYKKGPLLEAIEGNERKPPETAPEEEEIPVGEGGGE